MSIEKCPSENYPKVYDLTIPKTKNFGLANGLQVYDTSETGYIQRKLIKAMEDLKVYHNLSVRNADGNIIQYIYGEDGMNYTKIETQPLNYFNSNYTKIEKEHKFPNTEDFTTYLTAATIKEMKSVKSFRSRLTEYFNQIVEDVYQLRSNMFRNYRDNNVKYPVNLNRLINTIKNKFELVPDITTNLNPLYVIDSIKSLIGKLRHDHTDNGVKLFHILIRYHLSPK